MSRRAYLLILSLLIGVVGGQAVVAMGYRGNLVANAVALPLAVGLYLAIRLLVVKVIWPDEEKK